MIKHRVETLISEETLKVRVMQLGKEISTYYQSLIPAEQGQQLVLVGLLRGSFVFMADLSRAIGCPHSVDFMTASSYGSGTKSSGDVKILKDLEDDIEGKHVLVVEDIIDSGNTLTRVKQILALRNPASLSICTLLDKPSRREVEVDVNWAGFSIEDRFVVGYGIDYAEHYRHLPYVAEVIPES